MKPIKVLIVDDALFIRAILRNIFESDPQKRFQVVATAVDGVDALNKLHMHEIDVITLDIEMPNKNGLETLREIMDKKPTPVVMLSSVTLPGARETIEALSIGAFDFITKPSQQHEDVSKLKDEIREKAYHASKADKKDLKPAPFQKRSPALEKPKNTGLTNLIALGCSTGGPKALQQILAQVPASLPAAFVIVQHMPEGGYTNSLANHLNQVCAFDVKEAQEGDEITDGKVFIAPGGFHLEVLKRGQRCQTVLNRRQEVTGHRPSVDALFASVARANAGVPIYGVVLTGMGSDGAKGAQELKSLNPPATIVAESKKTAVVYGMPRQVAEKGLVDYVEDLLDVIPRLIKLLK